MAATRARTETAAASAPQPLKDVTPTREAASVDASAANDQTPARRTTNRTRKLPSRLLPSPSPPPSRPSSHYNAAARHSKGGKDATESPADSPAPASSVSSAAANLAKMRKAVRTDCDVISPDHDIAIEKDGDLSSEDLGPGKRKRRPSSMYKPPSTLTTVETPSPASATAAAKSKKKGRSSSPESTPVSIAQSKLKSRPSKGKLEGLNSASKKIEIYSSHGNGDDSEAEHDTMTFSSASSKRVRLANPSEDSMDLSPPPLLPRDGSARVQMPMRFTQPTFIRGGRVSVSPEAATKRPIKFNIQDRIEGPDFEMLRGTKRIAQRSDIMSSSPISAGIAKFDNDSGAPLTYVPFRCGARSASGFRNMHVTPFANVAVEEEDEEDEDDDENDFHQAMLDADLDFFETQKSDSNAVQPRWSATGRASTEEAEMDDTPATTPRSPQSGCDLPSPDSPRCKTEEDVVLPSVEDKAASFSEHRDSVFVHALPTTQVGADKPHQHAGSLTLSLPYSPAVAAASPQLRAMDIDTGSGHGSKDARASTQMGTPVLQRRKHVGLATGAHGLGPLKLSADLMERTASNLAPPYMQLSPMIEMESPLLSSGLSLSLHTKGSSDLPSPFVMAVGALPDLEQPAPLDLPPAEGSTTPKASSPEILIADTVKLDIAADVPKEAAPASVLPEKKAAEASKVEKPSARRPALPPPRQIRFTTFTTPSAESADLPKSDPVVPTQQQQTTMQHQQPAKDQSITPDLVHSSGSSSPDSDSDSPSPSSSSSAPEVETILFGPPEKLDLQELDEHSWDASKGALRAAPQVRVETQT